MEMQKIWTLYAFCFITLQLGAFALTSLFGQFGKKSCKKVTALYSMIMGCFTNTLILELYVGSTTCLFRLGFTLPFFHGATPPPVSQFPCRHFN